MNNFSKNIAEASRVYFAVGLILVGLYFRFGLAGYGFIGYAMIVFGILSITFFFLDLAQKKHPRGSEIIKRIIAVCLAVFLIAFGITEYFIIKSSDTDEAENSKAADYVIVLGAGVNGTRPSRVLEDRLEKTLEYMQKNEDTVCIVSGSMGKGEKITEAECMRLWLEERGVDAARIIKEEAAENTKQNIANSFEIIEKLEGKNAQELGKSVALITSEFHIMRAEMIAERMGLEVFGIAAETSIKAVKVNYFIREAFAVWYFELAG